MSGGGGGRRGSVTVRRQRHVQAAAACWQHASRKPLHSTATHRSSQVGAQSEDTAWPRYLHR